MFCFVCFFAVECTRSARVYMPSAILPSPAQWCRTAESLYFLLIISMEVLSIKEYPRRDLKSFIFRSRQGYYIFRKIPSAKQNPNNNYAFLLLITDTPPITARQITHSTVSGITDRESPVFGLEFPLWPLLSFF